jgi:tRNA(fMet)-specific endonuclease VapC
MTLFILDSDILSLLERGDPVVANHCKAAIGDTLATTVISIEEMLSGWYTLLRKAKRKEQIVTAYDRLATSVEFLAAFSLLRFPAGAVDRIEQFKSMKLGVRGQDMRIAAIVLEYGGTLVTRNSRDFQRIPGLTIEDWSQP